MIVKGKGAEALDIVKHDTVSDEPPPVYAPPPGPRLGEENTALHVGIPPSGFSLPSNYTIIERKNKKICDKYTIDPLLPMPEFLLPPLEPAEQTRPNLKLFTTNSSINSEVYICENRAVANFVNQGLATPFGDVKSWPRTVIVVNTTNSSITLKMRECPMHRRAPIEISASSTRESITVYLPRSFQGPIVTATSSKTIFSEEVQKNSTTFLEMIGSQTSFIGNCSQWAQAGSEGRDWTGDTARLTTSHAKIQVAYTDEVDGSNSFPRPRKHPSNQKFKSKSLPSEG